MSRLRCVRLLSVVIVTALPLGVLAPACSSTGTSTRGQLISCTDNGTGVTSCHAVDTTGSGSGSGSGSGTCEDIDEDGDGSPHDVGEDHHDPMTGAATDTGQAGSASDDDDDDDDDDGVSDDRDCDKRHGGDDDGEDHDGSDDGSGSGSDDGSGGH